MLGWERVRCIVIKERVRINGETTLLARSDTADKVNTGHTTIKQYT